jgi:hypothetical protein
MTVMIDTERLDQLLKADPDEFARQTLVGNYDHDEWINYAPSKILFFYGMEKLHACKQKNLEPIDPRIDGNSSSICSGLVVASRGHEIARHIGPLHALISCPKCCAKEVHSTLETVIIHDLHAISMVSRQMATLMECKACSSTGILTSSDYDDDRDYYLQCNSFIPLANGERALKDWNGLHRFLGFYIVC